MSENIFTKRREPFTFMLYVGIGGSALLFFVIFLLFLKKEFNNVDIKITVPGAMWLSTLLIVLSSMAMNTSIRKINDQNFGTFRQWLTFSYLLGFFFVFSQIIAWIKLLNKSTLGLSQNTGTAFLFVLSLLHVIHTVLGLIAFTLILKKAFKNKSYVDSLVYSVNPPNILNLSLLSKFWHFLSVLWVIIFLFLMYHAS
ncbi:MAG: heme-copper oxidase subunit III [Bacteroidetes bacterium]|nr:heme-copper oxidase subunit III [Bacteroidota bacterium]